MGDSQILIMNYWMDGARRGVLSIMPQRVDQAKEDLDLQKASTL